ncbi:hypothetical protein [Tropicimonas marinistellae]|uniref:hypothetical protein n=1 Tax=Tropicimonas marinistellae TaxID=1739787 RepID=UPI0008317CCE|nr:hypothetical protein [Tropicimonas marinistellae]
MFFELIAAITAGALGAGVVMILNSVTGGRLPRWAMPIAAGSAIIAFAIFMEYTWFSRTTDRFPEGVEVAFTHEARGVWRPWTYAYPVIDRFSAIDRASIVASDAAPEQRRAELLLFDRWAQPQMVPVVYDCERTRMAPLFDTVKIDDSGVVVDAEWGPVDPDDAAINIVCKEA